MPIYRFKGPDGQIHIAQADTPQAAQAGLQAMWAKQAPADHVNPVTGAMATLNRAIPFSSEAGAATQAALDTAGNVMSGKPADFGANYSRVRAGQQQLVNGLRADHPTVANLTTGVGYAAQAIPAMMSGGATVEAPVVEALTPGFKALAGRIAKRTAMTTIPNTVKNAVTGMATAGVNAAAQPGTLEQRIAAATKALPVGAVAGAAIPAGAGALKTLGSNIIDPILKRGGAVASQGADGVVAMLSGKSPADMASVITPDVQTAGDHAALNYLTRQGVTPDGLRQAALAANGKPMTTAETDPALLGMATGIVRRSGTSPGQAALTVANRVNGRNARISADVEGATGIVPQDARTHIESLVKAGQDATNPAYDAVRAIPGPVMTPELAAWAATKVGKKTIQSVADSIENVPGQSAREHGIPVDPDTGAVGSSDPNSLGEMQLQPTAKTWVQIHQRMGSMVDRDALGRPIPDAQSPGNYDVNQSKKFLGNALAGDGTADNPGALYGYRDALDQAGDYLGIKGAYDNAQGALLTKSKGAGLADPANFDKWFKGLKPIEQEAAKSSMANDLVTGMQNGDLKPGSFALPHVQMKLTTAFGPDASDAIATKMAQEHAMDAANARLLPNVNSTTGNVVGQIADGDAGGAAMLDAAGHALMGRGHAAMGAMAKGAAPFISAAKEPFDQAARNTLGHLLLADPADTANLLEAHQMAALPAPVAKTIAARIAAASMSGGTQMLAAQGGANSAVEEAPH
jgi:hypothetical protein